MGKKRSKKRSNSEVGESEMSDQLASTEGSALQLPKSSNRILICKAAGCFDMATVSSFCRLHYLSNWKKLKSKEARKKGQDLKLYLAELSNRFPEEFFEKLRNDVEEMGNDSSSSSESEERSGFDSEAGDEDIDTIIKGIRVEDF